MSAQNDIRDYTEIDTILSFPNETYRPNSFVATTWNNYFLFTNYNINNKNDSIYFYRIRLNDFKIDTFYYCLNGINNFLREIKSRYFNSIAYNGEYLALSVYNQLIIFKIIDTNFSLNIIKIITLKTSYNDMVMWIDKNKILLCDLYYSHKPPTLLTIFDIDQERIVREIQPYYNHVLWQYYPALHAIDYRNGEILFPHRSEYSLIVYDTLFQKKDSIYRNKGNWESLSSQTILYIQKKFKKNAAADIMGYLKKYFLHTDHLWEIYFLNDNQFMTICLPHSKPNQNHRYQFDIWDKKDNSWEITLSDIEDHLYGEFKYVNNTLTKNSFPLGILSGNKLYISDQYFIVLQYNGTDRNPIGLTKEEYINYQNEYFTQKAACIQLFFYKYNFK
ncbi:MAG: hypothetical protein II945_09135 [Bacteroidales bacterium]|nr:hypothetical protein [Bacteroidales bacterium]